MAVPAMQSEVSRHQLAVQQEPAARHEKSSCEERMKAIAKVALAFLILLAVVYLCMHGSCARNTFAVAALIATVIGGMVGAVTLIAQNFNKVFSC